MAYQRNIFGSRALLPEQNVLDERLEGRVGGPEEDADDHARDQDDRRALNELRLAGPFDLLQLGPRFGNEAPAACATRTGLALGSLSGWPNLLLALAGALHARGLLLLAAGATLLTSLLRHLPGLPMRSVARAPAAVLLELDAVGRVSLRLHRLVVAALALGAGERDCDSDSGCHSSLSSSSRARRSSGGRTRTFDLRIMIPLL